MNFVKIGAVAVILYLRAYMNFHILDHFGRNLCGSAIEPRLGRDFLNPFRPALGPTQSSVQWVPGLLRGG